MADRLQWNVEDLIKIAVAGQVSQPTMRPNSYVHWPNGEAAVLPEMLSIACKARVGDRGFGWAADRIHPGISIRHAADLKNRGRNVFADICNRPKVKTGQAAGTVGPVTGTTDHAELAAHGLDSLRLGDLVALDDTESRFNHGYLRDALAIGVVGATDGPRAGYGLGITVLMTSPAGQRGCFIDPGANIADLMQIEA